MDVREGPALTEAEFQETWGILHSGRWHYLDEAAQRVADAQLRRAVWWALAQLPERDCYCDKELEKAIILLGIELWPEAERTIKQPPKPRPEPVKEECVTCGRPCLECTE